MQGMREAIFFFFSFSCNFSVKKKNNQAPDVDVIYEVVDFGAYAE